MNDPNNALLSLFDVDEPNEPFYAITRRLYIPAEQVRDALLAAGYPIPETARLDAVEVVYEEETEKY